MVKQIFIEHEEKRYTLEYTRRSIEIMEAQGFKVTQLEDMVATMVPKLIYGGFRQHHPQLSHEKIDAIFDSCENKADMISALAEMYAEPLEALFSDEGKNGKWEKSW